MGLKLKDFNPFPKLQEEVGPNKLALVLSIDVPTVLVNWIEKDGFKGFAMRFLEELALKFKKEGNWKAFYVVFALLIHGIVLFRNIEKCMDHVAIEVFLSGNSFMQHMSEKGLFVAKELKYPQRLASLTASSITWYVKEWETPYIIVSCEEFPNVPLLGTKGYINYNPMLSRMQHDYSMDDPPEAKDLQPFIVRKSKEFGKRNPLVKEPYTRWVKERVEVIHFPFIFHASAFPKVPDPKPILPKDMEKLNAKTKKEELKKAEYRIRELGRMLDKSLVEKKEIKLDFESQVRELKDILKKCKDKLSREILQKEEAERNYLHLEYQLEETNRRFTVLESQEGDATYLLLKNDCVYLMRLYREDRMALSEDQRIIMKLQDLYVEWKVPQLGYIC
ncbi:uncharacterized protein LOC127137764 [Lathyrus oleraceus]|uniref:uncharacterized protein LOC127137764 n=1 Tax=Pisum sativum TaxID=3888 RepID=UPI0021D36EB4|nr:uncharacterized protein LOC127137764 [Pisum sativum]